MLRNALLILLFVLFAQNKIGFVQSDRIRSEYEEFKDAEAQLQMEYRQVNMRYNSMIVQLDSIKQAFETQRLMSSPEWRKEKEAEISSREATSNCSTPLSIIVLITSGCGFVFTAYKIFPENFF